MATGTVEELLKSLRGASPDAVRAALPALANSNVVVPVLRFQNLNDPQGTRRIQVVQRQNGDRREVSVFSSEDSLLAWAKDELYQCFSVAAGDLALTLPTPTWLVLESGTPSELVLSPEFVQILAWGEPAAAPKQEKAKEERARGDVRRPDQRRGESRSNAQSKHDPAQNAQAKTAAPKQESSKQGNARAEAGRNEAERNRARADRPRAQTEVVTRPALQAPIEDASAPSVSVAENVPEAVESRDPPPAVDPEQQLETLRKELQTLFEDFPGVAEAYLVVAPSTPATYLLGILASELSPEVRFTLIDEIAQRSQRYFGEAGAIEVYDDLRLKNSRSWELFQTFVPFFLRGETRSVQDPSLRSQVAAELLENGQPGSARKLFWGIKAPGSSVPRGRDRGE